MIGTTTNNYPADRGRSYAAIEAAAAEARLAMGYDLSSALPGGVWVLERLTDHPPIFVGGREIPVVWEAKPTPHGVEADTRFDPEFDQFVVRVDVRTYECLERGYGGPRPRFAVCHELGHVHLHTNELVRMAAMPEQKVALLRATARTLPVYQNTEWQAEAFGAALLMPAVGIEAMEARSAVALMRRWGVSSSAAEARLRVWSRHSSTLKEVMNEFCAKNRRATVRPVAQ
jgi:hypothetical protein